MQIHAWGKGLEEAFEQTALAFFGYATELDAVRSNPKMTQTFSAEGHDLQSLLYAFMNEVLFHFSAEFFVCRAVKVLSLQRGGPWAVTFRAYVQRLSQCM